MKLRFVMLLGLCGALGVACRGFAAGAGETDLRSIVNTGHTGAVRGLEYDERRDLLFSAGDDGTVRIWDAAAGSLARKLQVTQLGAELLAVNPVVPQVAVVVTDGTGSYYLSVWNWEEERQLFRVPLKEEPLFCQILVHGELHRIRRVLLAKSENTAGGGRLRGAVSPRGIRHGGIRGNVAVGKDHHDIPAFRPDRLLGPRNGTADS